MARAVSVLISGFGSVGREFARLLAVRRDDILRRYSVEFKVVAVLDSRGAAVNPRGFSSYDLLKLSETPRSRVSVFPGGRSGLTVADVYEELVPDIHVEVTPSNYETGEPGLSHARLALGSGASLVTANKAPLVKAFQELVEQASRKGLYLGYKATVMAGTPLVSLLRGLRGYEVEVLEGVLNATTNYVLSLMHDELVDLGEALERAKIEGVSEPDPRLDIEGWDAAAKLVIIANTLGYRLQLSDVERKPLNVSLSRVLRALRRGMAVKYVARLEPGSGRALVEPVEVPRDSVLGRIWGTMNAVRIGLGVNEIHLTGKGGGAPVTAYALLSDLLEAVKGWVPP